VAGPRRRWSRRHQPALGSRCGAVARLRPTTGPSPPSTSARSGTTDLPDRGLRRPGRPPETDDRTGAPVSTEMADLVLEDADEKMHKAVVPARAESASIRTGRAAPSLVEKLPVEYYGADTPLQQLASFTVPEARQLLITPYDKSTIGAIEKA